MLGVRRLGHAIVFILVSIGERLVKKKEKIRFDTICLSTKPTEPCYHDLYDSTIPEIQRCSLDHVVLQVSSLLLCFDAVLF